MKNTKKKLNNQSKVVKVSFTGSNIKPGSYQFPENVWNFK